MSFQLSTIEEAICVIAFSKGVRRQRDHQLLLAQPQKSTVGNDLGACLGNDFVEGCSPQPVQEKKLTETSRTKTALLNSIWVWKYRL
jgi:hypothetical protein